MYSVNKLFVVLGFLVLLSGCQGSPAPTPAAGPLEGVWQVIARTGADTDTGSTEASIQPGLYIFGKRHYSMMYVPGGDPRALFGGTLNEVTDSEKVQAYDTFIANSGTYEISESSITTRPAMAKNPNFMTGSHSSVHSYRIEADSLWLTIESISIYSELPGPKTTTKLVRVE
ncbi:uncharacterized protein METZ01_LOCUS209526 [marine metagenome]|uniref:Lipocalin-like domain-containing protein n=1 Tax=marine metagenome TaxID=408172 RepID=A0A382F209_9ZZZZ